MLAVKTWHARPAVRCRGRAFLLALMCLLSLAFKPALLAQTAVAPIEYTRVKWTTGFIFTSVSGARLLADGSLIVADPGARELVRVSGRGSVLRVLGRVGSGPNEYRAPQQILPQPRSQSMLVDAGQRRVMLLDSLGRFIRAIPFPPGASGLSSAVGADSLGRVVFASVPAMPPTSRVLRILRWRPGSAEPTGAAGAGFGSLDTLGTIQGAQLLQVASRGATGRRGANGAVSFRYVPYSAEDNVAVLPDGQVVVARAETGRLEWLDAQGRAQVSHSLLGPTLVPIDDSVRNSIRPLALRDAVPKHQPAFTADRMVVSPTGEVWIKRSLSSSSRHDEWIAISKIRGIVRRALLHKGSSILVATRNELVVVRRDDSELESIEVYDQR